MIALVVVVVLGLGLLAAAGVALSLSASRLEATGDALACPMHEDPAECDAYRRSTRSGHL